MNIILLDDPNIWRQFLPLTYTRPISFLRCGILTLGEKWQHQLGQTTGVYSENYLQEKYNAQWATENLLINSSVLPTPELIKAIQTLREGEILMKGTQWLAAIGDESVANDIRSNQWVNLKPVSYDNDIDTLEYPWQLFQKNGKAIREDFVMLTRGRVTQPISDPHTVCYNPDQIFLEEGAQVKAAVLNAENGPIYIGKDARIDEGALIRGPFALGEGSTVNMGAKMRGDITIGPHCKVGGEVSNSILIGYSNKGHDGFLGNSVLGEWCNLGADTNISNLKNNYAPIKIWSYDKEGFVNTGLQFCGLIMGDHAKAGINTMFNTATVVGVSANVFGAGFPRNFIPSFSWGGAHGFTTFQMRKAYEVAEAMMGRRGVSLTETDKNLLKVVFEQSAKHRIWEKS